MVFTIIVHIVLTKHIFHLKFNFRIAFKLITYAGFLIIASYILKVTGIKWFAGSVILFTSSFILALAMRLISIKGIFLIYSRY